MPKLVQIEQGNRLKKSLATHHYTKPLLLYATTSDTVDTMPDNG